MQAVNPKLIIVLLFVIAFVAYLQLSNPYKKYSRQAYWETATVEDVYSIPDEAFLSGNKNGPILFWAATSSNNPKVIAALVERGANVNESDTGVFSGTPMSAAAGYATNPEVIDTLVGLGADINKVVGSNNKTPLIIAAEINKSPAIIESLIRNGADVNYKDRTGRTALEQAIRFKNEEASKFIKAYTK